MRRALFALVLLACHVPAPVDAPSGYDGSDGGSCQAACASLSGAGCPEGLPTEAGTSCESFCDQAMDAGFVRLPLACVSAASSKDAIRACGVRCLP